jgi:hypothetical protein
MLKPVTVPIELVTGYFQPGTKPVFRLSAISWYPITGRIYTPTKDTYMSLPNN